MKQDKNIANGFSAESFPIDNAPLNYCLTNISIERML